MPAQLTNVNGTLFFRADGPGTRFELWKSDGSLAGTVLVKDINPGNNDSNPSNLTNVDGILYFSANDGVNGGELWKSDGTAAGTVLVKDIRAGSLGSTTGPFTNVGGTLYFTANDGVNGSELWKSDGTASGTVRISDVSSNNEPFSCSSQFYQRWGHSLFHRQRRRAWEKSDGHPDWDSSP